ncbi:hypothetical protein CALCODRAFT_540185 [Calocera cornea HHB12733]|uniref:Uncharacterized protein n=1 Tax=Calocera cornea HHB12733 TaxID=1353952 RepID=A0A166MPY3_9BASI|nr:hypothetical protein CALCODRAFT_540185 [Calocera cornea HHB12733]
MAHISLKDCLRELSLLQHNYDATIDPLLEVVGTVPHLASFEKLLSLHIQCQIDPVTIALSHLRSPLKTLTLDVMLISASDYDPSELATTNPSGSNGIVSLAEVISYRFASTLTTLELELRTPTSLAPRDFDWNELDSLSKCDLLEYFSILYAIPGEFGFETAELLRTGKSWPLLKEFHCQWFGLEERPTTNLTFQAVLQLSLINPRLKVVALTSLSWLDRSALLPLGSHLDLLKVSYPLMQGGEEWIGVMWGIACPCMLIEVTNPHAMETWALVADDHGKLLLELLREALEDELAQLQATLLQLAGPIALEDSSSVDGTGEPETFIDIGNHEEENETDTMNADSMDSV